MNSTPRPLSVTTPARPLGERLVALVLRALMRVYLFVIPESTGISAVDLTRPVTVLLTGQFYSANWAGAHLKPIAAAVRDGRVLVVSGHAVPPSDGVTIILPPPALSRVIGEVPARMLTFAWVALRERPAFVGGFHLLFNGLAAALVARLVGAASMYFCVGGVAEVAGGGIASENRVFGRLSVPDPRLEALLVKAVRRFDVIVTMGTTAAAYYADRGVPGRIVVNPGGIDQVRFSPPGPVTRDIDVLLVGRLVPIKRIDRFVGMVSRLAETRPTIRAVVVGDGPLAADLRAKAVQLGLGDNIEFAGYRTDVERYLQRAKIFMLTSESEGVALSMMEAMTAGSVPIVSNVGDLADVVDAESGYLVDDPQPATLARLAGSLLDEPRRLDAMAQASRERAAAYSIDGSTSRWRAILTPPQAAQARNT